MKPWHLVMCCLASMVMWATIGGIIGAAIGTAQEDDPWANCYVYGDGDCRPNGPWHGFVNLF